MAEGTLSFAAHNTVSPDRVGKKSGGILLWAGSGGPGLELTSLQPRGSAHPLPTQGRPGLLLQRHRVFLRELKPALPSGLRHHAVSLLRPSWPGAASGE